MKNETRRKLIRAKLIMIGVCQTDIAAELGISATSVNQWVIGKMTSVNLDNWFKNKFGEKELNEIKAA